MCTALGRGYLCCGPGSPGPPPAPPRDWRRFPSRARGEAGEEALPIFVPALTNEADSPSPGAHPAQESLGARGAAGALEQLHPLPSSACAGTTEGALLSLATQPLATSRSKPACSGRHSQRPLAGPCELIISLVGRVLLQKQLPGGLCPAPHLRPRGHCKSNLNNPLLQRKIKGETAEPRQAPWG